MMKFNSKQLILTLLKHSGLRYWLQPKKQLCTFFCSPFISAVCIHFVMNPMQFLTLNSSWQSNFLKRNMYFTSTNKISLRFTPGFSAHFPISTLHLLQLVYFDKSLDAICSPPEHKNLSV